MTPQEDSSLETPNRQRGEPFARMWLQGEEPRYYEVRNQSANEPAEIRRWEVEPDGQTVRETVIR